MEVRIRLHSRCTAVIQSTFSPESRNAGHRVFPRVETCPANEKRRTLHPYVSFRTEIAL